MKTETHDNPTTGVNRDSMREVLQGMKKALSDPLGEGTTGECKRDGKIITMQSGDYVMENEAEAEALKDDINAALAAANATWAKGHDLAYLDWKKQLISEREKLEGFTNADFERIVEDLKQQLATERDYGNRLTVQIEEAQQQLAAERDQNWRNAYDNLLIDYQQLREQLAAATARELHSYDVAKLCRDELAALQQNRDYYHDETHRLSRELAAAVEALKDAGIATGELADRVAHDCDFHAIDASKWWKSVLKARKSIVAALAKIGGK